MFVADCIMLLASLPYTTSIIQLATYVQKPHWENTKTLVGKTLKPRGMLPKKIIILILSIFR